MTDTQPTTDHKVKEYKTYSEAMQEEGFVTSEADTFKSDLHAFAHKWLENRRSYWGPGKQPIVSPLTGLAMPCIKTPDDIRALHRLELSIINAIDKMEITI